MIKKEDNVAGLLLLGCLVGVVMFICFALATLNLMASREEHENPGPDTPSLIARRDDLVKQQNNIQSAQKNLEKEIDYIKGRLAELAKQMAASQKSQATDRTEEISRLRQQIEDLEREKERLMNEITTKKRDINKVNVWQELGGPFRFKKPLFLECQGQVVLAHPGKKVLNLSDLNNKNPLLALTEGCDGIVLLVRPDGFKTFETAFLQAKNTGLKLAYEPVDAAWELDFSKGTEP